MRPDDFSRRTVDAIAEAAYRDGPPVPVPLDELAWALSKMTPDALTRLSTFLLDLTRRHPLAGPAWAAHRQAVEALDQDIRRALAAYEGPDERPG